MFLTNLLLAPKSKNVMVVVKSMVSGHKRICHRERNEEKVEMIFFDPYIGQQSVYKELKRIQSRK